MASTSVTNATVEARTTSDCDDGGNFFVFGRPKATLVDFGHDGRSPLANGRRPRDGRRCPDDGTTTARP